MNKYNRGKIYKITSKHHPLPYYGSTCQPLAKRLGDHVRAYKSQKKYFSVFLILECGDYKIELVEKYACNDKRELEKRETYYIKNNECVNANLPYAPYEDQLIKSKEKWKLNKHIYNKIIQCECGGTYMKRGKNRHLKTKTHINFLETGEKKREIIYFNKSIDCPCGGSYVPRQKKNHIKSKKHLYYEKTGKQIQTAKKEIINCPCGGTYLLYSKNRHLKTKKHMSYINQ